MLSQSPSKSGQISFFDIAQQLNQNHPLFALGQAFPWDELESSFAELYSSKGRKGKPIRLMCGILILKQMYNLSDEAVIEQWLMNPYYQVFCGETTFQTQPPCHSTELVKFRNRLGPSNIEKLFSLSVKIHGDSAEEETVIVDTTVQEKAITYPTDTKLAIKIINRLNKLAKASGIKQRRTFIKEVKQLRITCRYFGHKKKSGKARRALKRLRTIAGVLLRELQRKLPIEVLDLESERFSLYERVLSQQPKDKNKIYSLHEPDVYCVGKNKERKPYEYGSKVSVARTLESKIIVGVKNHEENIHDSKTLESVLKSANEIRTTPIETAVVDRGYRGAKKLLPDVEIIIPGNPLKRDSEKDRKRKRRLCQKRSGIEPVIGHLKSDYRLSKNWLKGQAGDSINLLMSACAWNLKKWMALFFLLEIRGRLFIFSIMVDENRQIMTLWAHNSTK